MPIPTTEQIKRPLLQLVDDGREFQLRDIVPSLADYFSLTEEERNEVIPSGRTGRFYTSCTWAQHELKSEGLLESTRRGYHRITAQGREVSRQSLNTGSTPPNLPPADDVLDGDGQTPEEAIEENYQRIRERLVIELLEQIKENSPKFFEELVIDLLVHMGYGGSRDDAEVVGRSGDGGIDGVIKEDKLGLDVIYVQAKRWEQNIGDQPIRDFVGALGLKRARKGIFITTSRFSESAKEGVSEADSKDCKVVLVDGRQLAEYMIDYNVGVSTVKSYEMKRVHSDYFDED